jgi:hypothetical protein
MSDESTYEGSCFCGAVKFTATGAPAAMGYCHCGSCRLWSAGPVNAFTLWPPQNVKVTRGAEQHRHVQQDAEERAQLVQALWRAPVHASSGLEPDRRLCGRHSDAPFKPACTSTIRRPCCRSVTAFRR